ncbi:MAG: SBBP repeat-containing protein [bacterium]
MSENRKNKPVLRILKAIIFTVFAFTIIFFTIIFLHQACGALEFKTKGIPGTLDKSFANNGVLVFNNSTTYHYFIYGMSIDSNGNIFLTGSIAVNFFDTLLIKFNSNSNLDTFFGNRDIVTYDHLGNNDFSQAIALDKNGNIYLAVTTHSGNNSNIFLQKCDIFLLKYLPNGTLDISFGNKGIVTFDNTVNTEEKVSNIAIHNNYLYIAGWTMIDNRYHALILKYFK